VELTPPRARPFALLPFAGCLALAVAAGLTPELVHRYLHTLPPVVNVSMVAAPVVFVFSAMGAYQFSGRRRAALLPWALAPVCFYRALEDMLVRLLWAFGGGAA
jgi:hypothetical protein